MRISETENCTIIFITHNIQEAIVLGTRIIVLAQGGRIVVDEKIKYKDRLRRPQKVMGRNGNACTAHCINRYSAFHVVEILCILFVQMFSEAAGANQ